MAFLNPIMLVGLVAVGIPLAIHLLGRKRPRQVPFSAMVFLEQLRHQQYRRLRLRHIILLLLRTLAIVFLVLAFARPALKTTLATFAGQGRTAMVVVIDDGPSMGYRGAEGVRLNWAREKARALADLAGPNDWAVMLRTSRPDLMLPLDRRGLETMEQPADWSGDGTEALRYAADHLRRADAPNREIYLITDLAGPPWDRLDDVPYPPRTSIYLLKTPADRKANLSVDSLWTGGSLIRVGRPAVIEAIISNRGETDMSDIPVGLWIGDQRVKQELVSVPAGQRRRVAFETTLPSTGWVDGRVDLPDDGLVADNTRWFVLSVPPDTRLLIIGNESPARQRLAAIFQSPEGAQRYLVRALRGDEVTQQNVADADVVVLHERFDLDSRVVGWIGDAIRRGAGLLMLTGPASDLESANRHLLPLFTDARFVGLHGASNYPSGTERGAAGRGYTTLARPPDPRRMIEGLLTDTESSRPRFDEYAEIRARSSSVLLRLTTGDPWLVLDASAQGRGAVLAAGTSTDWGDFATRGLVVPLMHRLVSNLATPATTSREEFAGPGETRRIERGTGQLELASPDGLRRPLMRTEDRPNVVSLGLLSPPGVWDIVSGSALVDRFPVNLRPEESDLAPLSADEFAHAMGADTMTELGRDIRGEVTQARTGAELSLLALLLAVGCIAGELVLMRGIATPDANRAVS